MEELPIEGSVSPTRTRPPAVPLGLNLGSLNYFSPTVPFVDAMKNSDVPQTTNVAEGGPWDTELISKVPLDAAGFPLEVPYSGAGVPTPQDVRYSIVSLQYAGTYSLLYEGDGDFEFPAAPVKVLDAAQGRQRLDVPSGDGSLFMTITRSDKANHVRNVRMILPGFESNYAEQVYHPRFLSLITGPSVLRFMDWQRTNGSILARWPDRATPEMSQATPRGASLETMIDLANRVGADPWFCVPHQADDDFVTQMASLIRDKLAPGRLAYIELSNELWNGIFEQYDYAVKQGCAAGLQTLDPEPGPCTDEGAKMWAGVKWGARRSAQIFEIFQRVFGGTDRFVRVLGGQAASPERNEVLLRAFASPMINRLQTRADALAIAPYFGAVADGLAETQSSSSLSVDTILQKMEASIDSQVREPTRANKRLAQRFGFRLIAYEGGQHLVATGDGVNDEVLTEKLIAANRDPRMAMLYEKMFDAWYAESGRDLLVLFNSAEVPSKYGSWGLVESQEQPTDRAPKYSAFRDQLTKLGAPSSPR